MADDLQTPAHRRLHPLPHTASRWTGGFWKRRFDACQKVGLAGMREALESDGNGARLSNFRIAGRAESGEHKGAFWSDGDVCKFIETMAHVYGVTGDPALDTQMDAEIAHIAAAQDADGYVSTQVQLTDKERWTNIHHHELYNMGHLMTAACVHHQVTGKRSFLDIAIRLADYLHATFMPRPPELANFGFNPSNIMGLVDLARTTGDGRYLDLASVYVSNRGSKPTPGWQVAGHQSAGTDQCQDRVPLRDETVASGHAVTATYLWAGATDVVSHTGEPALREALERLFADVAGKRSYVTGAVGAHHQGISRHNDKTHESFGFDYVLHNSTAYNETCANIGQAMWCRRMLALAGEARYADFMETVLYNSMLSGSNRDGTRFCYTNPLRWYGDRQILLSQDQRERQQVMKCYCCPPNVLRTVASVHQWAYSTDGEGFWVHLFGDSEFVHHGFGLRQQTNYPWDGTVTMTVTGAPADPVPLHVRIPAWADGATVTVAGETAEAEAGTYHAMERIWQSGDEVVVELPMTPRLLAAHPRLEEARNQVAVARGPLIYCLEGVDLPDGVAWHEVALPLEIQFEAVHEPDLLGGVTVLEANAIRVVMTPDEGRLYRTVDEVEYLELPLRLIPYYAWNNRGVTEMTVWLPIA